MGKVEKYEKLNKPGLWFMRSIQPAKELGRYVYELTVELGRPIVVYSNSSKKEIQNTVIDLIKTKCIENAPDITERVWLEQATILMVLSVIQKNEMSSSLMILSGLNTFSCLLPITP